MKETFKYYIDALLFSVILGIIFKTLEYFKVDHNPIYVIIFTLVIYVIGKIIFNRFLSKKQESME